MFPAFRRGHQILLLSSSHDSCEELNRGPLPEQRMLRAAELSFRPLSRILDTLHHPRKNHICARCLYAIRWCLKAGETAQEAKILTFHSSGNPRPHVKGEVGEVEEQREEAGHGGLLLLGRQTQVNPWGPLARQLALLSEFKSIDGPYLRNNGGWQMKSTIEGHSLPSVLKHTHACAYIHTKHSR